MKLPININNLLSGRTVEWERLEFKAGWNSEPVLHSLCAFANDFHNLGGGYIILGVAEENGRPVLPPVGIAEDTLDTIQQEILELGYRMQPHYHPIIAPCQFDGKWLLVLWAAGGQTRPYSAPVSLSKDNKQYAYYIRKGSSTVRARHQDEVELISLAAQVPFDDRMHFTAQTDDLNFGLVRSFLKDIKSDLFTDSATMEPIDLYRRMNIVDGSDEAVRPKNVGLLFFNEMPDRLFPQTQIDIVTFPEGLGGDTFTEKIFKGPIHTMLKEALGYLRSQVIKERVIKHPDRAEADRYYNYPFTALEEALCNAVYHRSYEIREPIEVRILQESITINSFPGPDRSIRDQDLEQHNFISRRYRNRRIGEFLKELEMTEGRGTGIPKMKRAILANGSPEPEFKTDDDRSFFRVEIPIHELFQLDAPPQVTPQVTLQVTPQVINLLSVIDSDMTRQQIQDAIGLTDRSNFRTKYLNPAIESGLVEMTIPDKPNSRSQKYRLTQVGLMKRKELNN